MLNVIRSFLPLFAFVAFAIPFHTPKALRIYFIDVEGGQATLIVSPSGQSLLVDTGWRGYDGRDADRIVRAAKAAKIKQLDYVLITHYHRDHVGGLPQLADRMKIGTLLDHGPNMEDTRVVKEDFIDYTKVVQQRINIHHQVVKPGDTIPLKEVNVEVLTAAGEHLASPLAGAGQPNSFCSSSPKRADDTT